MGKPQYVVVVFADATLVPKVTGPFRSRAKADDVAERINAASDWSVPDEAGPTIVAEAIALSAVTDLLAYVEKGAGA